MADAVVEQVHDVGGVFVQADVGNGAFAELGHPVEQVAIDRVADAEAEDAGGAQFFIDGGEDLGFVADVAVGHE